MNDGGLVLERKCLSFDDGNSYSTTLSSIANIPNFIFYNIMNDEIKRIVTSGVGMGQETIEILDDKSMPVLFQSNSSRNIVFTHIDERLTYLKDAISDDADMDKNIFIQTSQIFKQLLAVSNIDQWPYIGLVEPGYINAEWRIFKNYERLSIFVIGRDNIRVSYFDKNGHLIIEHLTLDKFNQSRFVLLLAV
jgi:hypothetical protein